MVGGDVESVARWWADPARHRELRSQYDTPNVTGFSWNEATEGQALVQEGEWTTARGLVQIRITTILGPDGVAVRQRTDGSFVREVEYRQLRLTNGGREDVTVSQRLMEFSEATPGQTNLVSAITVKERTGFPWWERALLRTSEFQHRMMHLQELVDRCEADIAAMPQSD